MSMLKALRSIRARLLALLLSLLSGRFGLISHKIYNDAQRMKWKSCSTPSWRRLPACYGPGTP